MITLLRAALIGVGASVLLLLGGLALAPFVLKDRVVELVGRQISERLEATVSFEEVELSLLSAFPATPSRLRSFCSMSASKSVSCSLSPRSWRFLRSFVAGSMPRPAGPLSPPPMQSVRLRCFGPSSASARSEAKQSRTAPTPRRFGTRRSLGFR